MYQKRRRQVGHRSKYVKIPIKTKLKFLRMVVIDSFSVKDSAATFKINYSTAKTLMRQYKLDALLYDLHLDDSTPLYPSANTTLQRCTYLEIKNEMEDRSDQYQSKTSLFYLQGGQCPEKQRRAERGTASKIEIISCTTN